MFVCRKSETDKSLRILHRLRLNEINFCNEKYKWYTIKLLISAINLFWVLLSTSAIFSLRHQTTNRTSKWHPVPLSWFCAHLDTHRYPTYSRDFSKSQPSWAWAPQTMVPELDNYDQHKSSPWDEQLITIKIWRPQLTTLFITSFHREKTLF